MRSDIHAKQNKATEMVVDELIAMRQEIGRVFPPRDREREMDRRGTDASGKCCALAT